jgi:light-regulated signal transduction histidine kinase (bacteriophytochrome)
MDMWCSCTYGGHFFQGLATLASMAIAYVAFQKAPKIRMAILISHVILLFLAFLYVHIYGPVFGVIDFPYDEILVFVGSIGWIIIVLDKFNRDRAKLVEQLKANNEELKSTTEELERFTYIASHDLKSPLRTIMSFVRLIERDVQRKNLTSIRKNIDFVKSGAEQMNYLVQDILDFSKLAEQKKAERSFIDLNLIFKKAKYNLKEEIRDQGAVIHCMQLPCYLGNELDFLLLFQNIIQNGIKYNKSKPPVVSLSFTKTDEQLSLSFTDNGIGIEAQYHDKIFHFFNRLHTTNEYPGTGLGLGLCKKIVDNYDGQIEVDSNVGKGTVFRVVLPVDQ